MQPNTQDTPPPRQKGATFAVAVLLTGLLFGATFLLLRFVTQLLLGAPLSGNALAALLALCGVFAGFADIWGVLRGEVPWAKAARTFAASTLFAFCVILPFLWGLD